MKKWLVLQGNQAYNVNFGHACNTTTIPMIVPEGNIVVRWSQGIRLYTARLSEPFPRVHAPSNACHRVAVSRTSWSYVDRACHHMRTYR